MQKNIVWSLILLGSFWQSGCLCCQGTWVASNIVDDISDHEAHLDHWYFPELDISRARMPDWNRCRFNRHLCQHGAACKCRCPQQVWYPSEFTTKYRQKEYQKQMQENMPATPSPELISPIPE